MKLSVVPVVFSGPAGTQICEELDLSRLPDGYVAVVFDPSSGNTSASGSLELDGTGNRRYIVAGTPEYVSATVNRLVLGNNLRMSFINFDRLSGRVSVRFSVPFTGMAQIGFDLYNVSGRRIWHHEVGNPTMGIQTMSFNVGAENGLPVASGLYILRMTACSLDGKESVVANQKIGMVR